MRPIRFTRFLPVNAALEQLWRRTVSYVSNTMLADMTNPLILGAATRLLAEVAPSTFPNTGAEVSVHDRTDHQPVLLRRAIGFIETNVADDIGLVEIANVVSVTPRALQYMFRRHLDTTPMSYLRRVRLDHAHRELVIGDRMTTTVGAVAARWGFVHTGRFAVLYRQTFGESPHATLRS